MKIKNLNEGSMDSFYQFFNYVSAYRIRLRSLLAVGIVLFSYLNIFGQLHITSSGTFLGLLPADQAAFQNQGAIIEPGVTFTIDFGLSMSPGKQILVEVGNTTTPGGVLIVQDKITSNSTWEGIVVQGDPTKQHYNQYPNPSIQDDPNAFYGVLNPIHGIVKLNGNTIIENAKHGVQVLDRGIVEALDPDALFDGSPKAGPKFINCKEGIFITNSNVSVSAIRLMNVDFEWTTLSVHGGSDYHGYLHIFLHNGVKDIYLGGCTFTNSDQNNYGTHAFNWGRGVGILSETITSLNTLYMGQSGNVFHQNGFTECMEIKVENRYSQIETGTMSNLSYGIYNTGLFIDFVEMVIDHTRFFHNMEAVDVKAWRTAISNCTFTTDDQVLSNFFIPGGTYKWHVKIRRGYEVLIYNNFFTFSNSIPIFSSTAVGSVDLSQCGDGGSAGKILVQNNLFEGNLSGTLNADYGLSAGGDLTNFEWICNEFNNNDVHVYYSGYGPKDVPNIQILDGARNTYSPNGLYVHNASSTAMVYHSTTNIVPFSIGSIYHIPTGISETLCVLTCPQLDQIRFNLLESQAGINELGILDGEIYPNPANNILNIRLNRTSGAASYKISSVTGEILKSDDFIGSQESINISDIAPGVYFISITVDQSVGVYKFIVN